MTRYAYNIYLHSRTWKIIASAAIVRANFKCANCGPDWTDHLEVHHLTYVRVGGDEHPEDLVVLCRPCHRRLHPQLPPWSARKQKAKLQELEFLGQLRFAFVPAWPSPMWGDEPDIVSRPAA